MTTPTSPSSGTTASSGNGDATLKDSAQQLGQQAKDKGREQVEAAREGAASHLETLADSARAAAGEMRDNDVANLSQYLTRMADGMSDFASRVRNKSGEEVFTEVRRLAQENPGLFVLGGLAVGFGLARFAKASASEAQGDSDRSQWRTGASTTAAGGYAGGSDFSGSGGSTGRADRPGADVVASSGNLHSSGTGSTGSLGGMSGSTGSLGGGGLSGSGSSGSSLGGSSSSGLSGSGSTGSSASTAGTGSPSGGTLGQGGTPAASGSPGERRHGLNAGTSDVGTGNNGLNHPASQTGAQSLGGHSATGVGTGTGTSNPNRGGQTR